MKLYLGNLPFNTTDDEIREAFANYGTVEDIHIPLDRETNRPRGFAFITLSDDDQGRRAIEELDGQDFGGRNLRVSEAMERSNDNRGGGGGGGGYRGGGGGGRGNDRRGGGGGGRRGGGNDRRRNNDNW